MIKKQQTRLTDERTSFKPFAYPWAYDAWLKHEQSHWLHTEVPMLEDVKDWKNKLTQNEKNFLTHIFRFFTQGDIDVAGGYVNNYLIKVPSHMDFLIFGSSSVSTSLAFSTGTQFGTCLPFLSFMPTCLYPDQHAF